MPDAAPKILHVFPGFDPGGTELRTVALINALGPRFRHRILTLTPDKGAAARLDSALGVEIIGPPRRGNALQWPLTLREIARREEPAVIITYNWGATDMILGARLGARCAFIHNECGFGPDEAERMIPRRVWTRRVLLNTIFRTVVVSEALFDTAQRDFRIAPERLQFIRTGVRTERFKPGRNFVVRRRHGLGEDDLVFGFVGGLRPEKNLPLLIRAFASAGLSTAHLLLVGEGGLRAELEKLAAELKVADRVIFAGRAAEPLEYYHAIDVFTMSSITEQTSNAQLEAMACGRPCILTDVGDCRVVLGEGKSAGSAVVASGDVPGFAAAMTALARDPGLRERAGRVNRERVVREYSFDRMVEEYAALWSAAAACVDERMKG